MNSPNRNQDTERQRLDQLLVSLGLVSTRSRARDAIARGCVRVNGQTITKPGAQALPSAAIEISDNASGYVSRAALKLIAGLDAAQIVPEGKVAIDLGASTGGFTQVLLQRGADHVFAVDVGHGQIHPSLENDDRVTVLEKLNGRDLALSHLNDQPPEIIVSDLSFISLTLGALPALTLAASKAWAVLLVKPQFEVGRDGIGKGGLVTDQSLIEETNRRLQSWFSSLPGWSVTHFLPSPISGSDGNQEFLLCGERT